MSDFVNPWSSGGSGNNNTGSSGGFVNPWASGSVSTPSSTGGTGAYHITPESMQSLGKAMGSTSSSNDGSGGSGWNGIIDNPIGRGIGNIFSSIGHGISSFEHTTGLDKISGAIKGAFSPYTNQSAAPQYQHSDGTIKGEITSDANNVWNLAKAMGNGVAQGFQHPQETSDTFNHGLDNVLNKVGSGKVNSILTHLAMDGTTDPLSYVPFGAAAKAVKTVSDAAHITPIVAKGVDAITASKAIQNPLVQGTKDFLGDKFIKNYGAQDVTKEALGNTSGAKGLDQHLIQQHMLELNDMIKHLSPAEREQIPHMIEGTSPVDPNLQPFIDKWKDLMDNGITHPDGSRALGTNAELNTMFKESPILDKTKENYYPLRFDRKDLPKIEEHLQKTGQPGFSTSGPFNQERTFNTAQDALNAGFKPQLDPILALGQRLNESSSAVRNAELLNGLMDKGVVSKDFAAGLKESSIPQLRGYHLNPADEAALKQTLEPISKNTLYDKALSSWKNISMMNSFVHGHNIGYNGMYLGGAKPSYVGETFNNLKNGSTDQWYQRALQSGAVSADKGGFMKNLEGSLKNVSSPIRDKVSYAFHGALWDADKALRTAIFRQSVEGGATEAEAAAKAQKFLVNYDNLTPFEQKVMTRIFPFYSWMKGNMPLQAEQWINNTSKQNLYEIAKNSVSQGLSGNDTHDGKIDTGIALKDGSHVMIDPYSPADEPIKMMRDGLVPFLYSKINPIIKEGADQVTNRAYYPGSILAPNGKEGMADATIRTNGAPASYNTAKTAVHAVNSILPINGMWGSALSSLIGDTDTRGLLNQVTGVGGNQSPGATPTEVITKALGGFTSHYNADKTAYQEKKTEQNKLKGQISYLKQTGQPVSKMLKKQAFRKIK